MASAPALGAQHTFLDAAKRHDWTSVERLLTEDRRLIDCQPSGRWSALHQAAASGNTAVVARLIGEFGASLDVLTSDGKTPLDVAAPACKEQLRAEAEARAASSWACDKWLEEVLLPGMRAVSELLLRDRPTGLSDHAFVSRLPSRDAIANMIAAPALQDIVVNAVWAGVQRLCTAAAVSGHALNDKFKQVVSARPEAQFQPQPVPQHWPQPLILAPAPTLPLAPTPTLPRAPTPAPAPTPTPTRILTASPGRD